MIEKKEYAHIQQMLQGYLRERFDDVEVKIADDVYYEGTNVIVTSRVFEGLLAEQRFHHMVRALPKAVYEKYLRRAAVCFELAPGESGRDLMIMPRASDVVKSESAILKQLMSIEFCSKFRTEIGNRPEQASVTHFDVTRRILFQSGLKENDVTRACLFMILKGAYCDAHVLADVLSLFEPDHISDGHNKQSRRL